MVYHCDCGVGSDAVIAHYEVHIVHKIVFNYVDAYIVHFIVVVAFVSVTLVCTQCSTTDPD